MKVPRDPWGNLGYIKLGPYVVTIFKALRFSLIIVANKNYDWSLFAA